MDVQAILMCSGCAILAMLSIRELFPCTFLNDGWLRSNMLRLPFVLFDLFLCEWSRKMNTRAAQGIQESWRNWRSALCLTYMHCRRDTA